MGRITFFLAALTWICLLVVGLTSGGFLLGFEKSIIDFDMESQSQETKNVPSLFEELMYGRSGDLISVAFVIK